MATRLFDAALENNQWDLCKDLVRFLKAIGKHIMCIAIFDVVIIMYMYEILDTIWTLFMY